MMSNTPETLFSFRLDNIQVTNSLISNPKSVSFEEENIGLEYAYSFKFNFEKNIATCLVHVVYKLLREGTNTGEIDELIIAHIDVWYDYIVSDLRNFVVEEVETYSIDKQLHLTLAMISFATSRGIVFEKTVGTQFNEYYLPLLFRKDFNLDQTFKK